MTQLQRRTEAFGDVDQRWIGSADGTDTARTVTLDYAAWQPKTTNHRIRGGEPVAFSTATSPGKWVPYASGGASGTATLRGFILNDIPVVPDAGDIVAPMMDEGRIILKYLPSPVAANATQTGFFRLIDVTA